MQLMKSIINIIWIFIVVQIKHLLNEHTKKANNRYVFEYLLLDIIQ